MLRRLLPAALLVVVACAVALTFALRGEDAAGPDAGAVLARTGDGPAGSAIITLRTWRYRADPDDRGRTEGWSRGDWRGRTVPVPYSPNARAFSGAAGERAYNGSVGWFAREIEAPVAGRYAVRLESAHHRATVFVDGEAVREHVGAYEPFTARVALRPGRHTIAVRVDWRGPRRQADAGWARSWFNYGGLNRPVTLMRLGPSEIGALTVRTNVSTAAGGGRARVTIALRVRNRGRSRTVRVRGVISRGGQTVRTLDFGRAAVGAGTSRAFTTSTQIDDPRLWSPRRPQLYDLRIVVPGEATLQRRIGLREIAWEDGRLRLNGAPLQLRGVALPPDARGHGDALSAADEARDRGTSVRATGANATRSQLPLADSMLERLDRAGILVWQEIGPWEPGGAWRADTVSQIAAARDRALRVAEAGQAHPSILAWTLTNEVAGNGQPEQLEYIRQTAPRLRELDPTRPVAADLWGRILPNRPGVFAQLDAIGVTDYVGWYEGLDLDAAGQAAMTRDRIAKLRGLYPGKPIVVTELGAAGSERTADAAFGGVGFQAALLGRRVRELRDAPGLSGAIVWNLRDYALRPDFRGGSVLELRPGLMLTPGLNEKGLYDFTGAAKPALAAVREAFADGGGP